MRNLLGTCTVVACAALAAALSACPSKDIARAPMAPQALFDSTARSSVRAPAEAATTTLDDYTITPMESVGAPADKECDRASC